MATGAPGVTLEYQVITRHVGRPYEVHRPEPLWWMPLPGAMGRLADPGEVADLTWASVAMVGLRAARYAIPKVDGRRLPRAAEVLTQIVTELLGRARGLGWIPAGQAPARADFTAGPDGALVMVMGGMDDATARAFVHGWAVAIQMAREAGRWAP